MFPGKITYIDWPFQVCNNNVPAHDNAGERSSQYAAENSCRTRFGPYTEWIAVMDTDEYLVPMGNYTNMKDVLRNAASEGTNILSFRSTRGKLRLDSSEAADENGWGREKMSNVTFLNAYNCDLVRPPKPSWADRARKQVYRSDYVLYHFVHYSTVTAQMLETYEQTIGRNGKFQHHFKEHPPSERVTDEVQEAVMVHAKTLRGDTTGGYRQRCRINFDKKRLPCFVGFPWPKSVLAELDRNTSLTEKDIEDAQYHNDEGFLYNC